MSILSALSVLFMTGFESLNQRILLIKKKDLANQNGGSKFDLVCVAGKKKSKTNTQTREHANKKESQSCIPKWAIAVSVFWNWNKNVILHFCFCNKGGQDAGTKSKSPPVVWLDRVVAERQLYLNGPKGFALPFCPFVFSKVSLPSVAFLF